MLEFFRRNEICDSGLTVHCQFLALSRQELTLLGACTARYMPWTLLPVGQGSFIQDFCAVNSVSRRKTRVCLVCVAGGETELFVLRRVCVKEQILFFHSFGEVSQLLW